jgi:hypothetical protein
MFLPDKLASVRSLSKDAQREPHLFQGLRARSLLSREAIETAAMMLGSDKSRGYCLDDLR